MLLASVVSASGHPTQQPDRHDCYTVLPVLPRSAGWVTLSASSSDADLRGGPWLSEPTLSRPRVRRSLRPVWWERTPAIPSVIAGGVVWLRGAAAARCCPRRILPLTLGSSTRSPRLIDSGRRTNSGGRRCDPTAPAAPDRLGRRPERLMRQPMSLPPIPHRSRYSVPARGSGPCWPGCADPIGSPLSRWPHMRGSWTRGHRSMFRCRAKRLRVVGRARSWVPGWR